MSSCIAALYSNGRVVTGCNHGEAFSKLSLSEQDGEIESGFFDPKTGRFFTEEYDFYLKQIFLIRHGEATGQRLPASLTPVGVRQIYRTAEFLSHEFDLAEFEAFTSPYVRCLHSSRIIEEVTGLKFSTDKNLSRMGHETPQEFLHRIHEVLLHSPPKAVFLSHSDFILNFTEQAIGHRVTDCDCMPGGAITLIDAKRLVYCGKVCYCEESKSKVL